MKKTINKFLLLSSLVVFALNGCSEPEKSTLPAETPQQVVEKFFSYLQSGGKRTLEEAHKLTNSSSQSVQSDSFRRWTEMYDPDTEITVLKSRILEQPSKAGEKVAEVTIGFKVPSAFGGFMDSTSLMHLTLDRETNSWKIDFLAETIDEEVFKKEG